MPLSHTIRIFIWQDMARRKRDDRGKVLPKANARPRTVKRWEIRQGLRAPDEKGSSGFQEMGKL